MINSCKEMTGVFQSVGDSIKVGFFRMQPVHYKLIPPEKPRKPTPLKEVLISNHLVDKFVLLPPQIAELQMKSSKDGQTDKEQRRRLNSEQDKEK